jgi:hypothetical protein
MSCTVPRRNLGVTQRLMCLVPNSSAGGAYQPRNQLSVTAYNCHHGMENIGSLQQQLQYHSMAVIACSVCASPSRPTAVQSGIAARHTPKNRLANQGSVPAERGYDCADQTSVRNRDVPCNGA